MRFLIAYVATAVVFFGIDFVWLRFTGERLYRPALGELMAPSPNLMAAGLFYLVYTAGVVVLAIGIGSEPRSLPMVAAYGALLGLVAYGTYDMTNLSVLKGWPVWISVIDMAWGTALTALSAVGGAFAVRLWAGQAG